MSTKSLLDNWKTTSAGLTLIVGSTVHLVFTVKNHTADENTWTIAITAILGGVGLILSGDASKSATKDDLKQVVEDTAHAIDTGNTVLLKANNINKPPDEKVTPPSTPPSV